MTCKLKVLSLAFAAVLAMGALSASTASAASFHSEQAHTILTGEQPVGTNDVATFVAGSLICNNATYSGTTSAGTTGSITVTPSYSGCTAFGFVSTPVDVNGCTYSFNAGNGALGIICTGSPMTITGFNCHIEIGTQAIASGITYDNAGSGSSRDVTITFNISGLEYTQTSKSFPGCSNGTFYDGSLKASATVKGTNTSGGAVGIWRTA